MTGARALRATRASSPWVTTVFLTSAIIASACGSPAGPSTRPVCSGYPDQRSSPYVLPYPVGLTYVVLQGNCGSFSHVADLQYAYDFRMPIGTRVTAAREGRVVFIEQRFTDGNRTKGQENLVVVSHPDGTFGRYIHLTKDGALVHMGDAVSKGDTIGLSGDTGFSTEPHLHFDVTVGCSQLGCQTTPITFRNTRPHPSGLVEGEAYTAEPYG